MEGGDDDVDGSKGGGESMKGWEGSDGWGGDGGGVGVGLNICNKTVYMYCFVTNVFIHNVYQIKVKHLNNTLRITLFHIAVRT